MRSEYGIPSRVMTAQDYLTELLGRVGAQDGATTFVTAHELKFWPPGALRALKVENLLTRAEPAKSADCPGCERGCFSPVVVQASDSGGDPYAFIVCDRRDDINRVPVSVADLERWQVSGEAVANAVTRLLGLERVGTSSQEAGRWQCGLLKGESGSAFVVLVAKGAVTLSCADAVVPLERVLALGAGGITVDRGELLAAVDAGSREPMAGFGSPAYFRQRGRNMAAARYEQPGGTWEKHAKIRAAWAEGRFASRDACARAMSADLNMSFSAARKVLRNSEDPKRAEHANSRDRGAQD